MTDVLDTDSTIDVESSQHDRQRRGLRDEALPTLTIVFHPNLARVGQQARLSALSRGTPALLSRLQPSFYTADGKGAGPLRHRRVSRTPISITLGSDAVSLAPAPGRKIFIDDGWTESERRLPLSKLKEGIVIQLTGGVTLLLKSQAPSQGAGHGLLGVSDAIAQVRREIDRVGPLPHTVLIRGESGTGKELVARALHAASPRAREHFVAVNMAALNQGTATAQLFGHVRGAFTGATSEGKGYFREAHAGTLFLDEIGSTEPSIQPLLLRALENREVQPVGDTKIQPVDVRLITATDAHLEQLRDRGEFNRALYNRLAAYELWIPPLRERREDIGPLFFGALAEQLSLLKKSQLLDDTGTENRWFSASLVPRLLNYAWPGNVRELKNAAASVAVNSSDRQTAEFTAAWAQKLLGAEGKSSHAMADPIHLTARTRVSPSNASAAELSDDRIFKVLEQHRWVVEAAAKSLGISKTTLYERVKKHPAIVQARDLTLEQIETALKEHAGRIERAAEQLRVSPRALQRRLKELGASQT